MLHWILGASDAAVAVAETLNATQIPQAAAKGSEYAGMTLLSKGLVTTGMGLVCVFLVLALLFATIKVMQRIKRKDDETSEN